MNNYGFVKASTEENIDLSTHSDGAFERGDVYFKRLGELFKKINEGTLSVADATKAKSMLKFSVGRLNQAGAGLTSTYLAIGGVQDAVNPNRATRKLIYALDEIIKGNSAPIKELLSVESGAHSYMDTYRELMQFGETGTILTGVNEAFVNTRASMGLEMMRDLIRNLLSEINQAGFDSRGLTDVVNASGEALLLLADGTNDPLIKSSANGSIGNADASIAGSDTWVGATNAGTSPGGEGSNLLESGAATTDYTFTQAFAQEVNKPLDEWDYSGGAAGGSDEFFKQLGEISKKIKEGTLAAADAANAKAVLQSFSDGLNRINAGLAAAYSSIGGAQDGKFAQAFKSIVTQTNFAMQQVTYALDEIIAGNSASIQKFMNAASGVLKNVGGILGLMQIGQQFYANGLTSTGVDEAGKKALGVLTGLAGGEIAAMAVGGIVAFAGAPVIVVAAAAIGSAVVVGYFAGKAGEALWEPSRWWFENQFLPNVFDAGTQASNAISTGLTEWAVSMGNFDGTWLEGLNATDEEKALLTTLIAGASQLPASAAMNSDIKRLLEAPFEGGSLISRDILIRSVLLIAKEQQAYPSERVSVNAGAIALDFPPGAPMALDAMRELIRNTLSEADKSGFALRGPSRLVIAPQGGTLAALDGKDNLLLGSSEVDGLIGGNGADDLIAGGGDDTLLGGANTDDLFGGEGNDVLDGGEGSDYLRGGIGSDTYRFNGSWGSDTIIDSDGLGFIEIDGVVLEGGKKVDEGVWHNRAQGFVYTLVGTGTEQMLTIQRDSSLNSIRIRGWQNGGLGLTMDDEEVDPPATTRTYSGDQRALIRGIEIDFDILPGDPRFNTYKWDATTWTAGGSLDGGIAEESFSDVIDGSAGTDNIAGLNGNDALDGLGGDDRIDGGEGSDLIGGGAGIDTIHGGVGDDYIFSATGLGAGQRVGPTDQWSPPAGKTLLAQGSTWGVYANADGTVIVDGGGAYEMDNAGDVVFAEAGKDRVTGGLGGDYIDGGEGDDVLWGHGGNDVLIGDIGADWLMGDGLKTVGYYESLTEAQHGDDVLDGGEGNDGLIGGGLDDVLYGGVGADNIWGDDEDEAKLAGAYHGQDHLDGGVGNDFLAGGGADDTLVGGGDDDVLYGDERESKLAGTFHGADWLDGGDGVDQLMGGGADDVLYGGIGNDSLFGDDQNEAALSANFHGDDYLDGEDGDDQVVGGGKDDTLFGGAGSDAMWGDNAVQNLASSSHGDDFMDGGDGDDYLVGGGRADTLLGGTGNDELQGDSSQAALTGEFHGDDFLDGGDGNDLLIGHGGNDSLIGGADDDVLDGDSSLSQLAATFHGNDYLDGGEGNDTLIGEGGDDQLFGGAGNDWLSGEDQEYTNSTTSLAGNDSLYGGDGDDILVDGSGDNFLSGDGGNDSLWGGAGNDSLLGGTGNDSISSGGGNDLMVGGAGSDTFYVSDSGVRYVFDENDGNINRLVLGLNFQWWNMRLWIDSNRSLIISNADGTAEVHLGDVDVENLGGTSPITQISISNDPYTYTLAQLIAQKTIEVPGTDSADILRGTASNDLINALGSDDEVFGGASYDRIYLGAGNDIGHGGEDVDYIYGEDGDDLIHGDQGDDFLYGGDGADIAYGGTGADNIRGALGNDTLYGDTGNDTLYGEEGDDLIIGGDGNDWMVGDEGIDAMVGGTGDDTMWIEANETVIEYFNEGIDQINAVDTDYTLGENLENLTLYGLGISGSGNELDNILTGNALNNILSGGAGNDRLNGGLGIDTLIGGAGHDVYVMDDAEDTLVEMSGEGIDLVESRISTNFTLPDNIENLTVTSNGTGNALNNTITAGAGANTLSGEGGDDILNGGAGNDTLRGGADNDFIDGGIGNDQMYGGSGDDVFIVDSTSDLVTELVSEGVDTIYSSVAYTLGANLENLVLTGTSAIGATGNGLSNTLSGNGSNNVISGGAGDDVLDGGAGADTLTGGSGNDIFVIDNSADTVTELANEGLDTVRTSVAYVLGANVENLTLLGASSINGSGNGLSNVLTGNAGNNTLDGGAGSDFMVGGIGDDTYIVDASTDSVTELTDEGYDLVQSSVSYTLAENLENLTLTGNSGTTGTGNALANTLIGNAAKNTLIGNDGDDVLDGKAGGDTMTGGSGDDSYYVDSGTDTVNELANQGVDTVISSINYTLNANVENLRIASSTATNATGNALDNVLYAGAGSNILDGLGGVDTASYLYAGAAVTVTLASVVAQSTGGSGSDTLKNIENLTGSGFADALTGSAAANVLDGGIGNDALIGGLGNDIYLLNRGGDSDSIAENDSSSGNLDIAAFGDDIAIEQLWFKQVGDNLEVNVIGTNDKFTVQNWYLGNQYHIEKFQTSDGHVLMDSQVQNLVQAMSSFTPPAAGQTMLPAGYQSSLAPVFAASWQ